MSNGMIYKIYICENTHLPFKQRWIYACNNAFIFSSMTKDNRAVLRDNQI